MLPQVLAIGNVNEQLPRRPKDSEHLFEHSQVVPDGLEIPETVAEDRDRVETVSRVRKFPCIPFPKLDFQAFLLGAGLSSLDQIVRAVDPLNSGETPARQFENVPSLTAAEVQYPLVRRDLQNIAE